MKISDVRLRVALSGEWVMCDGAIPERHIRYERRPIEPGETYPRHVNHTPIDEHAPYPDGMTHKIVLIHEGIPGGPYEHVVMEPNSGLPLQRLHWED